MSFVGQIESLWRYPVKSMQGEQIDTAVVVEAGLLGDRGYAIRDVETGYIASAKHPRRWKALIACRARYQKSPSSESSLPAVEIILPDGSPVCSTDPSVHDRLSAMLGRSVRLITAPGAGVEHAREADRSSLERVGSGEVVRMEPLGVASPPALFFDYAPLHLLSSATLGALTGEYPDGDFDVRRFRPNLFVRSDEGQFGFVENHWIGNELLIGAEVRVKVIDPTPRCVVTTLAQPGLESDPGVLRTIHQWNSVESITAAPGVMVPAVAGVYVRARQYGRISRGDTIRLIRAESRERHPGAQTAENP